tara:strand:- start:1871 stop:2269 length:399 start_codon:yes stop_codon:yes gene_type:complete
MDGFSSSKFLEAIPPAVHGTGSFTVGTTIDARGYLYAHFTVHTGAVAGAGTVPVQIESSATSGGSYADVTGAVVTAAAAGVQTIAVRLDGASGFIRVKAATTGGTSIALGVMVMLTNGINSANYASTPTVTV